MSFEITNHREVRYMLSTLKQISLTERSLALVFLMNLSSFTFSCVVEMDFILYEVAFSK